MKIKNHRLEGVQQIESPNQSGTINPSLLVLHYTASGEGNDAKYFQNPAAKASAHIVVERDGTITQCVAFNKKAWHAGKSVWNGRSNCNDFSIGIEIDNWGLLTKRADGTFRSHAGSIIDSCQVLEARNKLGNGQYCETYNDIQLSAVEKVVEAILEYYPGIQAVVGHEDIAPRRKIDPGPALYNFQAEMNNKVSGGRRGEEDPSVDKRTVISQGNLNVRSGPSTNYPVIDSVAPGKWVEVLYDAGDWAQIAWPRGWVYDAYLEK